jgi:tripartite-type tricarboxylate transporter receptor subunit TctC
MSKTMSVFVAAALVASALPTAAQDWPKRPLTIVVPYGPGSGADVLGRIIAPQMSEFLGQPIIIENVAGGGGMIGSARVAKAPPDGYQSVIGTAGTHAQNQFLYKNPPYQPSDFAPVVLIADQPFVLITRKDLPVNNLQDFIAYAKANQNNLKYGSPGTGSAGHLACALFNNAIGVDIIHVPYRGAAQAMTDLIAGVIDYQCAVVAVVLPQLDGKTIKPVALLAPERSPFLPGIASSGEQGLPDFDASTWNALFLPKATPTAIVQKLNTAAVSAMQTPAVRDRLRSIGAEPPAGEQASVDYMTQLVARDVEKWAAPIRAANINIE